MEELPEPPGVEVLVALGSRTVTLPAGARLDRIFRSAGAYPGRWNGFRQFGPLASRFDHHSLDRVSGTACEQDRGILYAADGPRRVPTCLAEMFRATRTLRPSRCTNAQPTPCPKHRRYIAR